MRIMTAHRILIGTAVAFFLLYAGWEAMGSDRGRWLRAGASGAGAVGLALYFRTLPRTSG